MKVPAELEIAQRFCGPPKSANGGYACGRLAAFVDGPAEVTLRRPPPLDKAMRVVAEGDGVALYDGGTLIGSARPATVELAMPRPPTFAAAHAAELRTIPADKHNLPTCFVCGPHRAHGDGLRIHVGPLEAADADWSGPLAATWVPPPDLADAAKRVRPEFVWAALDCPTGYAAGFVAGDVFLLLGRQAVSIYRLPMAGEKCVIVAWQGTVEGRKHFADAVLSGTDGEALAICRATWIAVEHAVMRGDG
jgi:hypothetical protein